MRKNSSANALSKMPEGARTESRGSVGRVGTSDSLDQKEKEVKNEKVRRMIRSLSNHNICHSNDELRKWDPVSGIIKFQ